MKKILMLIIFIATSINSQEVKESFDLANDLYKNERYSEAIDAYKKIESKGFISPELYYNLGNSYYKLNKVGPSIYYFEMALKLNPKNDDVKNNLVFAKRLALDNIEELPKSIFQKINENYLQKLSYNEWSILSVAFCILGSLLFLFFYYSYNSSKKRLYFILSFISFILFISSLFITYNQYQYSKNNKIAIVFSEEAEIMNAPTLNSEEIFKLHEGTKIVVLDSIDNWMKIKIADGKQGWIISNEVKLLDNF